jgi:hypothetical protein
MFKNFFIIFTISVFFISCATKHEVDNSMPSDNVSNNKILDTSTLITIYKKPDKDKCEFIENIKKYDFDFKSTKQRVYKKALEKEATHIYIYKITTAYTNTPKTNKENDIGSTSGEVFLIKAKIYKCKDDDEEENF